MSDNIHVAIRVRPLIKREIDNKDPTLWATKDSCVIYHKNCPTTEFFFDRVFNTEESNALVYRDLCAPIVQSVMEGFNGTIFAYGQTSSGKTYTMTGEHGIVPSAVQDIFDTIDSMPEREFLLRVSYMEIYNECIMDLMSEGSKELKPVEDIDGVISVLGLSEEEIKTSDDVFQIMKRCEKRRRTGDTQMNDKSSRSHAIFRMIIESRMRNTDDDSVVNVGQLNLVDLAGSERPGQMGTSGERYKEGININKSLLNLAKVINQLSAMKNERQHISYRDSKLTRILQNSLGGNARTIILCTVTPVSYQETLSTLNFASSAKKIKNKPKANVVSNEKALLKQYTNKIKMLSEKLESLQQGGEKQILEKELEEKSKQNENLKRQIQDLKEKFVVSQFPIGSPNVLLLKRARRETWCPGEVFGRKSVQTDYKQGLLNPLPTLKEETNTSLFADFIDIKPRGGYHFDSSPVAKKNVSIQTEDIEDKLDALNKTLITKIKEYEELKEFTTSEKQILEACNMEASRVMAEDLETKLNDFNSLSEENDELKMKVEEMTQQIEILISQNNDLKLQCQELKEQSCLISPDCMKFNVNTKLNLCEEFEMLEKKDQVVSIENNDLEMDISDNHKILLECAKQTSSSLNATLSSYQSLSNKLDSHSQLLKKFAFNAYEELNVEKFDYETLDLELSDIADKHIASNYEWEIKTLKQEIISLKEENEQKAKSAEHFKKHCAEKDLEFDNLLNDCEKLKENESLKEIEMSKWKQSASEQYDKYLIVLKEKVTLEKQMKNVGGILTQKEKLIKELMENFERNKADLYETVKSHAVIKEKLNVAENGYSEEIEKWKRENEKLSNQLLSLSLQLETQKKQCNEIIENLKSNYAERSAALERQLKMNYEYKISMLKIDLNNQHSLHLAEEVDKLQIQIASQASNFKLEKVKFEEAVLKENRELVSKIQSILKDNRCKLELSEKKFEDLKLARKKDLENIKDLENKKAHLENLIKERDGMIKQHTEKFVAFKSNFEKEYYQLKSENSLLRQQKKMNDNLASKSSSVEKSQQNNASINNKDMDNAVDSTVLIERNFEIKQIQEKCAKYKEENRYLGQKLSLCQNEIRRLHELQNESKLEKLDVKNAESIVSNGTTTSFNELKATLQQKDQYISKLEKNVKRYEEYLKAKGHRRVIDEGVKIENQVPSISATMQENTIPKQLRNALPNGKPSIRDAKMNFVTPSQKETGAKPLADLQYDEENCNPQ